MRKHCRTNEWGGPGELAGTERGSGNAGLIILIVLGVEIYLYLNVYMSSVCINRYAFSCECFL